MIECVVGEMLVAIGAFDAVGRHNYRSGCGSRIIDWIFVSSWGCSAAILV